MGLALWSPQYAPWCQQPPECVPGLAHVLDLRITEILLADACLVGSAMHTSITAKLAWHSICNVTDVPLQPIGQSASQAHAVQH